MADQNESPLDIGAAKAAEVLARRIEARTRRSAALAVHPNALTLRTQLVVGAAPVTAATRQTAGFLVAAGDSWFDYPIHDVLSELEDNYGYNVESAAHKGDPIEAMAYQDGQLDKLARCIDKVKAQGGVPKAVLLSGGGDDIAGQEFGMLLNNATSPISGWNDEIVDGVINRRIAEAYRTMLHAVMQYCQSDLGTVLPILVHGYDFPVPDGRGFLGGWGPLPGPWLKPGFREKLFAVLETNTAMMAAIIGRFNTMLANLTAEANFAGVVHFVDVRGTLSNALAGDAYQEWWANELHPTHQGFTAVAARFQAVLRALP
jgi:hypothetical protein